MARMRSCSNSYSFWNYFLFLPAHYSQVKRQQMGRAKQAARASYCSRRALAGTTSPPELLFKALESSVDLGEDLIARWCDEPADEQWLQKLKLAQGNFCGDPYWAYTTAADKTCCVTALFSHYHRQLSQTQLLEGRHVTFKQAINFWGLL